VSHDREGLDSTLPHFYYSPAILNYTFGPNHPLKPERLRRTIELLGRYGVEPIDPGLGNEADLLRVHSLDFVEDVKSGGSAEFGFGPGDNPAFTGMFEAALAYVSASAKAAEAVRDGADLAFGIGGGLHHARRSLASGFCIFNDCAVACSILRERFTKVAYVDIDVHHGDGVQWIFYEDPTIMTCSIHEEGRTLYPGTGFVEETGKDFSSLNVPLMARTTPDVWIDSFERGILPSLRKFQPEAIVLQMGTDTHFLDPLGHIESNAQSWLRAVEHVKNLGLPIVALGGGGYNLTTVPRMWTAACLTLGDIGFGPDLPKDLGGRWDMPHFFDRDDETDHGIGREFSDGVVDWIDRNFIPNVA
jgi:acetoin utilization protein AcuC